MTSGECMGGGGMGGLEVGQAHQGTHGLLGAVKLHKCHATGPPISMHHKVDAIRAYSVPSEEPASHPNELSADGKQSKAECTATLLQLST